MTPWTQDKATDTWVVEMSSMGTQANPKCPNCKKPVLTSHRVKTEKDANDEDITGWRYEHPCGAKLLIIND